MVFANHSCSQWSLGGQKSNSVDTRDVNSREIAFPGWQSQFPGLDRDSRFRPSTAWSELDRRQGSEGWRGDHRPDPAPFPADNGIPSPPADDQHSRQWRAHNGQWEVMGERDRGRQRPSARGRQAGESPRPAVGHRWTIGRRRGRDVRVKRRAAAGSPAPWRTCQKADVQHDGGTRS